MKKLLVLSVSLLALSHPWAYGGKNDPLPDDEHTLTLNFGSRYMEQLPAPSDKIHHLRIFNISLSNQQFADLIRVHPGLMTVTVGSIGITSIEPLTELKNLQTLTLRKNEGMNYDPIGKITTLQELNLTNNDLVTLPDSFSGLTQLTKLNLSENERLRTNALPVMTSVKDLDLSYTKIADTTFIASVFPKVTDLNLGTNFNRNSKTGMRIGGLGDLKHLERLNMENNELTPEDIRELSKSQKWLKGLSLRYNNNIDPAPLSSMEDLLKLDLSFTNVKSLNFLSPLTKLEELNLACSSVPLEIRSFPVLPNLRVLNVTSGKIKKLSDLEAGRKFPKLEELILAGNEYIELDLLSDLKNLKKLELSNKTTNMRALYRLPSLEHLILKDPEIRGGQVLKQIPTLKKLTVGRLTDAKTYEGEELRKFLEDL